MTTSSNLQHTLLVVALAGVYPLHAAAAASAGIAQFIAGDVNLRGADGKTDALLKGKDIESGQAIVTGANGRAQVRFSDGGLVSLQPNTEFKIASYVDKANPQEDRFLVDFLRGSMRAVTGLIGKRNRANYKVTTTTATIGIRGSGFSAAYNPDGSLNVTAEKDAIEVCSAAVCIGLVAGESAFVRDNSTPPKRTPQRASIPTPGPMQEVEIFGNQTNSNGISSSFVNQALTGTFTSLGVSSIFDTGEGYNFPQGSPPGETSLVNGQLTAFVDSSNDPFTRDSAGAATSVGTIAGGDFVGWGVWLTGTKTQPGNAYPIGLLHYVVGVPTALMPISGTASYSLIGSTAPTLTNGTQGTLNSATFSANFNPGYQSVSAYIDTSFGYVSESGVSMTGSRFSGSSVDGAFFGTNAARAGLVYKGYGGSGAFTGAAVFQK